MFVKVILILLGIGVLVMVLAIGIGKLSYLDRAMRIIVAYVAMLLSVELTAMVTGEMEMYEFRIVVLNLYMLLNIYLVTFFFIFAINQRPGNVVLSANLLVWPCLEIINIMLLQPINTLNSNFLLLESFCIISLSLYFIYRTLKQEKADNIFQHPHFRIAMLLLLMWSVSLFFWATIKILYRNNWKYAELMMHIHELVNILAYCGVGLTLIFHPKRKYA